MTLKISDPAKNCQHCGATFNRRDGENRTDYLRRKACSRKCSINITHGNPEFVEWLMGWPQGWTDLKPLEMGRFREWQAQHGGF